MKQFLLSRTILFTFMLMSGLQAAAQDFSWRNGGTLVNLVGTYGTQGTAAAGNTPGGRKSAVSWRDNAGNFWLFGGHGYDNAGNYDLLNDLWRYNPVSNQWTWMGGSNAVDQLGTYGTQGSFAPSNIPGARRGAVSWVDGAGNLWLMGGFGYDAIGQTGELNDLWLYDIATNAWKWVKGSNACFQNGIYGTLGTAAAGNAPGGRSGAVSWKDASGNLWMFGGYGFSSVPNQGSLNDLWRYTPGTNQWTWMKGSNALNAFGTYGTQAISNPANTPGGRATSSAWTDLSGNLWLIGGYGYSSAGAGNLLSDLWQYDVASNQWTWYKGYTTNNVQQGIYGTSGVPAPANMPGARYSAITWTDGLGDLWLFSGYGFDTGGLPDYLNDLWRYDIAANTWVWVKGSNVISQPGIYGIAGQTSPVNIPGSRGSAVSWKDGSNNLWLFGGSGYDAGSNVGDLNDVWKFFNCIDPIVTINSSTTNTACAGISTTLTAGGAYTYTWSGGQTTASLVIAPLGTSNYSVNATDINECEASASFTLNILNLPPVNVSGTSSIICAGESTSLNATGAITYSWNTTATGADITVTPTITTDYTVTGTDANGCYNTATVTQSVAACVGLPDHEALAAGISVYPNPSHGEFSLLLNGYEANDLVIYNALGQLVAVQKLSPGQHLVKTELPNGIYQYRLMRSAALVAAGKLVIE